MVGVTNIVSSRAKLFFLSITVFLVPGPHPGAHRGSPRYSTRLSYHQEILRLLGVRNWSQRPNIRTKDVPNTAITPEIISFRVPGTRGRNKYVFLIMSQEVAGRFLGQVFLFSSDFLTSF